MIVLDTHAWLWWASEPDRLSRRARESIVGAEEIGVCAISCWEIGMLVRANRLRLDRDVRVWVRQALAVPRLAALPLTPEIAVGAALLGGEFPGDPADRIIYATAVLRGSSVVTKDQQIAKYDRAQAVW